MRLKHPKTIKDLFSTIILFCLSLSIHAQIPNTKLDELKVMTWNIWYGFSQLDASQDILPVGHPFMASQAEVQQKATAFLLSEAPDVLALQELNDFNATSLELFAASFGHNYSYIFDRDTQQPTGITSKYPLQFLEGKNDTYNGTNLEGTFAAKLLNEPIVFIVVHLKSANKNHRRKENDYVFELYEKYRNLNNHVILLGDFNSMSISDRSYAEVTIDKRLQYRIFKNKCNHELNKVNQPDSGMEACTTWDYSVMDDYWNYTADNIIDTTDEFANRATYISNNFWGTFPSSSVKLFHDETNLDHNNNSTTTHLQKEHLARIDYILASKELADYTTDARIIHNYLSPQSTIVLLDEMSDHYPLSTTFTSSGLSVNDNINKNVNLYPNPLKGNVLQLGTSFHSFKSAVLYDFKGEKVYDCDIKNNQISFSYLEKGIYLLRFDTGLVSKIIKE